MKAFKMLVEQIRKSFKYDYNDAERYAKYLQQECLREYRNACAERVITQDGK